MEPARQVRIAKTGDSSHSALLRTAIENRDAVQNTRAVVLEKRGV